MDQREQALTNIRRWLGIPFEERGDRLRQPPLLASLALLPYMEDVTGDVNIPMLKEQVRGCLYDIANGITRNIETGRHMTRKSKR